VTARKPKDAETFEVAHALVVTSGDPAGIGPEVTHKAVRRLQRRHAILEKRPLIVVGDAVLFARHLDKPSAMHTYNIVPCDDFVANPGYLYHHLMPEKGQPWRPIFLDCGERNEDACRPGHGDRHSAERSLVYLSAAIELLHSDIADAVCTGPIHKANAARAGFPFPGQTEMFGEYFDVRQPVMMLVGGGLRVSLATIHVALQEVPKLLTKRAVRNALDKTLHALLQDFGVRNPRVAVCGLNPHAGEDDTFGHEDRRVIRPVVNDARRDGWEVEGPLSADTVFALARKGRFDAVVAMYHDQGLIPVKTLAFDEGVNLTLGLPIVRTSPDHGTAFDIAGKHKADEGAMTAALELAHELSTRRARAGSRM
jgi:4-hydroxythreonine-4-phosphate dehydrogenase